MLPTDTGSLEPNRILISHHYPPRLKNDLYRVTHRYVVDPDHISTVKSDSITSPDVLGVYVCNGNIPRWENAN